MGERIIGIDPGIARLGYGIIDTDGQRADAVAYGCIETPADWSVPLRLQHIYRALRELVEQYRPRWMAVEELFFNRNTTTAFVVGQARGVAILAGVESGLELAEYTPMQVKLAVTGYGKAEKRQIQEMVRILLRLAEAPKPDDTADALAVALTHAHTVPPRARTAPLAPSPASPWRTVRYGRGIKP
ncbi:crossover junction endodeoxyribonuclease RuvC [Alicyclobacillus contaminans]|uniref:crossover junction endodeoxyribonuclease RuvC n=1 Tax=Alicyclobacillus contaminans TaxID=392016 RepID=UPI00040BA608|nr:crossover junction endodeoxyribonuclease RuvC [Alicyclobacillus contaminans]GMA51928.1 crossover junction endodeoxyribonuclease RuvC [Alicyclobacillus contaminans]